MLYIVHQSVNTQYMRFAGGIIEAHSTPISALLVEDGHPRATFPSGSTTLLQSPNLLRPK